MVRATEAEYFGHWGNVPADVDVRPFSSINPIHGDRKRKNKKHHYVSVTYMDGFTNDHGRVWAYRAEDPINPHQARPASIGYRNYYYSQRLPEGEQEHHRLEDMWSSVESVWKETIRAVKDRRVSPAISFNLLGMATIMRARVPASRERHEVMIASKMRAEVQAMEKLGILPTELERYAGQFDSVPIGVNPHETLLAMKGEMKAFGDLCFELGFEVLHNRTGLPFITSDNPVCSYNPRRLPPARVPYDHAGEIELIFPLDSGMLLRGSSKLRPTNRVSRHRNISDRMAVRRLNRTVVQFGYGLVIAQDRSSDDLARRYAGIVPTVMTDVHHVGTEIQIIVRDLFAPRPILSQFIDTPEKAAALEEQINRGTQSLFPKPMLPLASGPVSAWPSSRRSNPAPQPHPPPSG